MAKIHQLLNQLATAERQFQAGTFIAPSLGCGQVNVRIAGVVTRYPLPQRFVGYGRFRTHQSVVTLERRATLAESRDYRRQLTPRSVLLIARADDGWLAAPAHLGDRRFDDSLVVVNFTEDVQPFDRVRVAIDGSTAWFDSLEDHRDVDMAINLRACLRERILPDAVQYVGLTPEYRHAYRYAWRLLTGQQSVPKPVMPTWDVTGLVIR